MVSRRPTLVRHTSATRAISANGAVYIKNKFGKWVSEKRHKLGKAGFKGTRKQLFEAFRAPPLSGSRPGTRRTRKK